MWVLTGGNGAGKTTFYNHFIRPTGIPLVNADSLAKALYPDDPESHSYISARLIDDLRHRLLIEKYNFCFETVFSHPSKIDFIADAKARGYETVLVYIHVEHPQLNAMRVAQRVSEGGHNVPAEKIFSRIPRVIENVRRALPLCDVVRFYDNSSSDNPFVPVRTLRNRQIEDHLSPSPEWVRFFE